MFRQDFICSVLLSCIKNTLPPKPSERLRTDILSFTASHFPIWLLIFFISVMLLPSWLLAFNFPFLCCNIFLELLSWPNSSRCVAYAWLMCRLLILPSTTCSLLTWRVDEVTYSQMIDIFISGRECFNTSGAEIYLEHSVFQSQSKQRQIHPSQVSWRPKFSLFALSICPKDRTGLKEGEGCIFVCFLLSYASVLNWRETSFVLIYGAEVHDLKNVHYASYWKNSICLPNGPCESLTFFFLRNEVSFAHKWWHMSLMVAEMILECILLVFLKTYHSLLLSIIALGINGVVTRQFKLSSAI